MRISSGLLSRLTPTDVIAFFDELCRSSLTEEQLRKVVSSGETQAIFIKILESTLKLEPKQLSLTLGILEQLSKLPPETLQQLPELINLMEERNLSAKEVELMSRAVPRVVECVKDLTPTNQDRLANLLERFRADGEDGESDIVEELEETETLLSGLANEDYTKEQRERLGDFISVANKNDLDSYCQVAQILAKRGVEIKDLVEQIEANRDGFNVFLHGVDTMAELLALAGECKISVD